jgi:putative DNA primase/helicase
MPHFDAESLARELGGAKKTGQGWWNCKCPAHDDDRASLGLKDADDGGVAWKCNAGCDKATVGDALKAKGLLPGRPKAERESRRRIVATYEYRNATGALVLQVVRYAPKIFCQRRPDPDRPGKWIWSVGDIAWPPIRPSRCSWSRARRMPTGCGP